MRLAVDMTLAIRGRATSAESPGYKAQGKRLLFIGKMPTHLRLGFCAKYFKKQLWVLVLCDCLCCTNFFILKNIFFHKQSCGGNGLSDLIIGTVLCGIFAQDIAGIAMA